MGRTYTFGSFITEKRTSKNISLRKFANDLEKAPSYVCDIEKDKKNPIDKNFLMKMAKILSLDIEETNMLFDLSAKARKEVAPTDLTEYIKATPLASIALRSARDSKISDEKWHEIIELIQKKV